MYSSFTSASHESSHLFIAVAAYSDIKLKKEMRREDRLEEAQKLREAIKKEA